jgi:hypothetical protein
MSGNVIGVIVSKLDALRVARVIADIPQNINFAIKASVAANFLDSHSIGYSSAQVGKELSSPEVVDAAKAFSVEIRCTGTLSHLSERSSQQPTTKRVAITEPKNCFREQDTIQQTLDRMRAAANAAVAARSGTDTDRNSENCVAMRQYYWALVEARGILSSRDADSKKDAWATQFQGTIRDLYAKMPSHCRPTN